MKLVYVQSKLVYVFETFYPLVPVFFFILKIWIWTFGLIFIFHTTLAALFYAVLWDTMWRYTQYNLQSRHISHNTSVTKGVHYVMSSNQMLWFSYLILPKIKKTVSEFFSESHRFGFCFNRLTSLSYMIGPNYVIFFLSLSLNEVKLA